jgi:predicted metal-binding membrane protein
VTGHQAAAASSVLDGLSRRVVAFVTVWLTLVAVLAWVVTARQASSMSGMVSGLAELATPSPMAVTAGSFLATWVGMTTAMMFPTAVPMVAAHRMVARRRGDGPGSTVAFVLGYLLAWTAVGVFPLLALVWFRSLSGMAADSQWLAAAAGLAVAATGAYQFSGWKSVCLRHCRSPLAFLMTHDFGGGATSAVRAGVVHGGYCLGCCWAAMSLLLVVGLMNLVWMAGLTLLFLAEKCWRHGVGLTRLVGAALIVLGLLVVLEPGVLTALAGTGSGQMEPRMGM